MKKYFALLLLFSVVITGGVVSAAKPDKTEKKLKHDLGLPAQAKEVASDVFYLGKAMDKEKVVEGYAFIHRKDKKVKPGTECGNGVCDPGENANKCAADCSSDPTDPTEPDTSGCYTYLAKSAKWKTTEDYIINPLSRDIASDSVLNIFAQSVSAWENAAQYNLAGIMTATSNTLVLDTIAPDNKNEVYFGSIADEGVIAITMIWGVFGGPPKARELVEWDQIYDEADFVWSDMGEAGKMDLLNIATHEMGHSFGLGDLYEAECADVTMYGYASEGETNKVDLELGDVTGIQKLY